jgi:hypothetical protein
MSAKVSRPEIEKTIAWLLEHKQKDVQAVLRKFRKLAPNKQRMLDKKLLYLASILDHAVSVGKRSKTRCKACGYPMHVRWFGCQNPVADAGRAAQDRRAKKVAKK